MVLYTLQSNLKYTSSHCCVELLSCILSELLQIFGINTNFLCCPTVNERSKFSVTEILWQCSLNQWVFKCCPGHGSYGRTQLLGVSWGSTICYMCLRLWTLILLGQRVSHHAPDEQIGLLCSRNMSCHSSLTCALVIVCNLLVPLNIHGSGECSGMTLRILIRHQFAKNDDRFFFVMSRDFFSHNCSTLVLS